MKIYIFSTDGGKHFYLITSPSDNNSEIVLFVSNKDGIYALLNKNNEVMLYYPICMNVQVYVHKLPCTFIDVKLYGAN